MSVLAEMFDGLNAMSLSQLLAAFVASIGYVLMQGGMLASRGRLIAFIAMVLGIAGFALQGADWVRAVILAAFAIAGFGSFTGVVWLMSRVLGLDRTPVEPSHVPALRLANGSANVAVNDAAPSSTANSGAATGRPRITGPVAST